MQKNKSSPQEVHPENISDPEVWAAIRYLDPTPAPTPIDQITVLLWTAVSIVSVALVWLVFHDLCR